MSKQLSLAHFFASNRRTRSNSPVTTPENQAQSSLPSASTFDETQMVTTSEINCSSVTKKSKPSERESPANVEVQVLNKNDIGLFVNKDHVSNDELYAVLSDPWIPSSHYKFPQIEMNQKVRSVCQHSWLSTYPWLSYSHVLSGVVCRYCALFQRKWSSNDRAKNPLCQLVLKPLTALHKARDCIQSHQKTEYHLFSEEQAEKFVENYLDPNKSIDHILDNENQQQEATNRKFLSSIIKCILFIAKKNLAFRGHDDDGVPQKSTDGLGNMILQLNEYILVSLFS